MWLQRIASSFTTPNGEYTLTKVRLNDDKFIVPESASLLRFKAEDQMRRGEQMATDMPKSRKKSLMASKRGVFGNQTPRERTISSMFGRLQVRGGPAVGKREDNVEESKGLDQEGTPADHEVH